MTAHLTEPDPAHMLDLLGRATPVTRQLIEGLAQDDWSAPTPCPEWTVLEVVEHVVSGLTQFADVGAGAGFDPSVQASLNPADALAAFEEAAGRMLSVWSDPAVAGRVHSMPWGDTPGATLIGFMVMEQLAHGWDLALASGRAPAYDDDLAAEALAMAEAFDDPSIRVPGMFGPVVTVGAHEPTIDRVAGFLGRDPDWSPPVEVGDQP